MRLFKILPVFALTAILFQGCSDTTEPTPAPPTPSTTIAFKANGQYTYNQDKVDTAATPAQETRDSSNRDVITSTVLDTNKTVDGKTGVVMIENVHSTGVRDTSYFYQSGGILYQHNFGLTSLNTNAQVLAVLGDTINVGWVALADLTAASGKTWTGGSTKKEVTYLVFHDIVTILDAVTEAADVSMTVNGKAMNAKHAVHTITATGGSVGKVATLTIDSYVTQEAGVVLTVSHTTEVSVPASTKLSGQYTVMTSFK